MKVPWILRWQLAWAALTGNIVSINYDSQRGHAGTYQFEVVQSSIRGWLDRRDLINARRKAARSGDVRQ